MSDPFGASNPFGGGTGGTSAAPPSTGPVHTDPQPQVHSPTTNIHFDDNPFGSPCPPRTSAPPASAPASADASPTPSVVNASPAASLAAAFASPASQAQEALNVAAAHVPVSTVPVSVTSEVIGKVAQAASAGVEAATAGVEALIKIEKQAIGDWKYEAIENCYASDKFTPVEIKANAVSYAEKKKIRLDSTLLREADEDPSKLTNHLRLTKTSLTYERCNRVEVEGATRNAGKAMELPYWTYTFKVHTTLPDYKGQPHQDGQKEDTYSVVKNMLIFTVERRYKDFEWLRKALVVENPGVLVPPIPEKTFQGMKEKMGKKEEAFDGKGLEDAGKDMGPWQSDADAKKCNSCGTGFGMVTRKHHCRHCMKIFCSSCCPKPKGSEKRFCNDCASLKGLAEMLMKSPEVSFRMKTLHMFLSECMNGPLAYSETLRFFIEAPSVLLASKKDAILKKLEVENQVCSKSAGDVAREKIGGVQSWWSGPSTDFTGLSSRGAEWRHHANRLHQHIESFSVLREQLSDQLFEGLKRKKNPVPELPSKLANDSDLRALTKVTEHVEDALMEFKNFNKEYLFMAIATTSFLIGMQQAMINIFAEMDKYEKMKKGAVRNPEKLNQLNIFLDDKESVVKREMTWLMRFTASAYKQICVNLWKLERVRDPCDFDWEPALVVIDALKDPKF